MEKSSKTIFSLIISCFVAYSLIVPTSHIFGLEDSTLPDSSERSQSPTIRHQISTDNIQDLEISSSEPQKADDPISEQGSSKQSERNN